MAGDNEGYRSVLIDAPDCLFNPVDARGLARTITMLMDDPAKRKALKALQQKILQQFDVAIVGPKIELMYQSALHARKKVT